MERKVFTIEIKASPEKVWEVLWNKETYGQWTAPFMPGSLVESDWKENGKALFLSPDGDGITSKIVNYKPFEKMHFTHQGVVHKRKEDTTSEEAKMWRGAIENYTLVVRNTFTELQIETDIFERYKTEFEKAWPKALEKVKELAESR